jgi:hypothetical protein
MRNTRVQNVVIVTTVIFAFFAGQARAQNPVEDAIKQLTSENAKGYLQPLVNSFGANLNAGVYHSPDISTMGFSLKLEVVGMGTMIGDAEKVYKAVAPASFGGGTYETATIFGGAGTMISGPGGTQYQFQNGQVKTSIVPLAAPQLTIGNVYGTQAVVRYVPIPEIDKFPKTTLFGIGARHNVSQHLPMLPLDVAVGFFYQTLTVGELIDAKTFNIGVQGGKSFAILDVYGGLQYETSSMDVNYKYTGPNPPANPNVSLNLTGENSMSAMAGLGLHLAILHLNGTVNLGKVTVLTASLGFGI